jgi:putative phosphoribosyl transferase
MRVSRQDLEIPVRGATLGATLEAGNGAGGLVLVARAGGNSSRGARNRLVPDAIQRAGLATLVFDLLTREEEADDQHMGHLRFNVGLFAQRIAQVTEWALAGGDARAASVAYFSSGTGAAAALVAASRLEERVNAVVACGGRPDLAGQHLELVTSPTLLIVGERDAHILEINREAQARMRCTRELAVIPRASHHFEESGALGMVAELSVAWFLSLVPSATLHEIHSEAPAQRPRAG